MPTILSRWECAVALFVSPTISIHTLTDSRGRKAMSGPEAFLAVSTCDTIRPRSFFFDSYQPALSSPQEKELWIRHFSTFQAPIQPFTEYITPFSLPTVSTAPVDLMFTPTPLLLTQALKGPLQEEWRLTRMRFNSTSWGPQAPPAAGSTAEASLGVGDFHDVKIGRASCRERVS